MVKSNVAEGEDFLDGEDVFAVNGDAPKSPALTDK